MIHAGLRRALMRALEQSALPIAGGAAGAYGGSQVSADPLSGAMGGGMIGAMGGFGARGLARGLMRRMPASQSVRDILAQLDAAASGMPPARNAAGNWPEYEAFNSRMIRDEADEEVRMGGYDDVDGAIRPDANAMARMRDRQRRFEALADREYPTMNEVIEGGLRGDEDAVSRGVPAGYLPTRSNPGRGAGTALFGGMPDPAHIRSRLGIRNQNYSEADIVQELTLPNERGEYPRISDVMFSLDEEVKSSTFREQISRMLKRAKKAVSKGEGPIHDLARMWNVTPDRVIAFAKAPWRLGGFSAERIARDLIETGITEPAALTVALRRALAERGKSHLISDASLPVIVAQARRNSGLTKSSPTNRRRRRERALSAALPYLITGGVGAAISTVADREARRRAIMQEMSRT